jgi:polyhydroxyalkanoate synthesis regulator phasin
MTQEQKALLYDDIVRQGDVINREISKLKSIVNRNPEQQAQLDKLNEQLAKLEAQMNNLLAG